MIYRTGKEEGVAHPELPTEEGAQVRETSNPVVQNTSAQAASEGRRELHVGYRLRQNRATQGVQTSARRREDRRRPLYCQRLSLI